MMIRMCGLAARAAIAGLTSFMCLALPSLSSAQGGHSPADWDRIVAAARKEGRVMMYTSGAIATAQRALEAFRKKYPGIGADFQRGSVIQTMPRLEQERLYGLDGGDVLTSAESLWFLARAQEGKLLKPAGPALKEWPAAALINDSIVLAGKQPFIVIYNKNLVANPPKGYADLLKPEFKGKIGSSAVIGPSIMDWLDWLEQNYGADYLVRLRAQNPKLYSGSVPLSQSVAAGEVAVGAFALMGDTKALIAQGAPIGYVIPSPGRGAPILAAAFAWSKRPNAALVLLDFIMSREGQAVWHGTGESASALKGIPGALVVDDSMTMYDNSKWPPERQAKAQERLDGIFK